MLMSYWAFGDIERSNPGLEMMLARHLVKYRSPIENHIMSFPMVVSDLTFCDLERSNPDHMAFTRL